MGLRLISILLLLQCGDRLQISESDVYRRQILTTEVDSRAVRVIRMEDKNKQFNSIRVKLVIIRAY